MLGGPIHVPTLSGTVEMNVPPLTGTARQFRLRGKGLPGAEKGEHGDLFVSIGTSAVVYPAAYLPQHAADNGALCVEINPDPTPASDLYSVHLRGPATAGAGRYLPPPKRVKRDEWPARGGAGPATLARPLPGGRTPVGRGSTIRTQWRCPGV